MTKEEKKAYKQTDVYKYKKSKALQYTFGITSWLALIAPDCTLIGIKWNTWITNETDAIKVGVGLTLCIIVSVFALYKKFAKEFKFTGLTAVIGFWLAFGICVLAEAILQELTTILLYASLGVTSSFLLDIPEKYYKNKKIYYAKMAGIEKYKNEKLDGIVSAIKEASGFGNNKDGEDRYIPVD